MSGPSVIIWQYFLGHLVQQFDGHVAYYSHLKEHRGTVKTAEKSNKNIKKVKKKLNGSLRMSCHILFLENFWLMFGFLRYL